MRKTVTGFQGRIPLCAKMECLSCEHGNLRQLHRWSSVGEEPLGKAEHTSPKCTNRFHRRVKSASTTTRSYLKYLEHLIPRHSPFAEGPRRDHHRLRKLHGNRGILPVSGRTIVNCYLRRASGRESGHCDEYTSSSSGNSRQAPKQ